MLDAACPGEVFTSPVPDQMLAATKAVDGGAGVLFIVKNYTGDVLNFQMAAELAAEEGITVETVLVDDDVAVQDSTWTAGRRGIGATVIVEKIAGAAPRRAPTSTRWRRSGSGSTTTAVLRGGADRAAPRPPPASPASTCPRTRWRSASASTANPDAAGEAPTAQGDRRALVDAILHDSFSRRAGHRDGQRPGRHAADRAVRDLRRDRAAAGGAGVDDRPHLVGNYVTSLDMAGCRSPWSGPTTRCCACGTRRSNTPPCAGAPE